MSAIFRHSIEILRATTETNALGDDVEVWSTATPTVSGGWSIDAGDTRSVGTTSAEAGRDGAVVVYTIRHLGVDVDIRGTDRVRYDGRVYSVEGEVTRQPGPTWRTTHTIVALSRATG